MQLYFIRHAIAVDRAASNAGNDAERRLTGDGEKKMKRAARGLARLVPSFDVIHSSPYRRAVQTAEIVAKAHYPLPEIKETPLLEPGAGLASIEKLTRMAPIDARIAFVGHEPDFGEIIAKLVTGSTEPVFVMKKGAVCRVDLHNLPQPGCGLLVWHLQPKILRMIR